MNNKLILLIVALSLSSAIWASKPGAETREPRQIFTKAYNAIPDKAEVFKAGSSAWVPYPSYNDRAGWDELLGDYKAIAIKNAEKLLNFEYKYIPASTYLEYEKTHDRKLYKLDSKNKSALATFFFGELAEGKGRFLSKIIDGVYFFDNCAGWSHPQHSINQKSGRVLMDPEDRNISLLSAHHAATMAVIWHFLHEEFDKVDPSISKMTLRALEKNTFEPYLDETKKYSQWWLQYPSDKKTGVYNVINNWTTYCNTYVTTAFLFACQDQDKLMEALQQAVESNDRFMDYVKMDGACEEGPSYWEMAGAKAYEFAKLLYYASGKKLDVLKDKQIRNFGEWRAAITVGDRWLVAFGDGFSRGNEQADILYRYGYDCDSQLMMDLSLYLFSDDKNEKFNFDKAISSDVFRTLEKFKYHKILKDAEQKALADAKGSFKALKTKLAANFKSLYYPETEFASLRNKNGWMLGAKGGHNKESHNHNDLGSGVLFIRECPVLIDPGVSTYGPRFYEGKQYGYWNKYSYWHNTPSINGAIQFIGREYYADQCNCDVNKNIFSTDLSHAYKAKEACCKKWLRTFALADKALTITDDFELSERKAADVINFIAQGKVYLPGETCRGRKIKEGELGILSSSYDGQRSIFAVMSYPKSLKPAVEILNLKDPRFVQVWGEKIERITLTSSEKAPLKGKYTYKLIEL